MNTIKDAPESLTESQSLLVIKEMIQVSKNKFRQDGILFIVWGWFLFFKSLIGFAERKLILTYHLKRIINYAGIVIFIACVVFTVYYLLKQRKKVQTYIGVSLRYVWISLFVCMVLVNLIQFNVTQNINFELQQPILMVLMAFAVTVTGGILRYRLILIGGGVFGILALTASYLKLPEQLLVESAAWVIAFIIPGHLLFAKREN